MFRRKNGSHTTESESDKQESKVKELRASLGEISDQNAIYVTESCLRRYLEARNWNVEKSKKMLEETLKWRSSYKPEEIRWSEVANEGETGKMYRANFTDREGRTVLILRPAKQNTDSHEGQLKLLVYMLENATMNLPEGQEQMVWLIDFSGWSISNSPPIKTSRETVNILQNHYPERLSIAFLYNPPKVFHAFFKVVKYFMDPKTFNKVQFVYSKNEESLKVMHKYFDPQILPMEFGGEKKIEYDHVQYSKMMENDDVRTAGAWGLDESEKAEENLASCVAAQAC
ncbi:hypothetical protein LUZ60_006208 [Juncus effusus]|nr:hypothetical protein LUZ60_006208 [Juncus effusus]